MAQRASAADLALLSGLLRFRGSDQEKITKAENVMDMLQADSLDELGYILEPPTIADLTSIQCSKLQMIGAILRDSSLLPEGSTPETATLQQWETALKNVRAISGKGQSVTRMQQQPRPTPGLRDQLQASKTAHLSVVKTAAAMTASIKLVNDDLELLKQELSAALTPLNLNYLLNLSRDPSGAVAVPAIEDTNATPMTERGPQQIRANLEARVQGGSLTVEDSSLISEVLLGAIAHERMRHCQVEALDDIITAAVAANRNRDAIYNAAIEKAEQSPFQLQDRKLSSNLLYSILIRVLGNTSFYYILTEGDQDTFQDGRHAWARINEYDSDPKLQARKIEEDFRRLRNIQLSEGKTVATFLNEFEKVKASIIKRLGPNGCQARDESSMYNTFVDGVRQHPTLASVATNYLGLNGDFRTIKEISERLRNAEKDQGIGHESGDDYRKPAAVNRMMAGIQLNNPGRKGGNVSNGFFKVPSSSIPATAWEQYNHNFDKLKWQLEKKTFDEWQKKGFIPSEYRYDHTTLESYTLARIANNKAKLDAQKKKHKGKWSNAKTEKQASESKTETAIVASANRVSAKKSNVEDAAENAIPQYDFGNDDDYDHLVNQNHLLDDHL